jgi:hypothetical protein
MKQVKQAMNRIRPRSLKISAHAVSFAFLAAIISVSLPRMVVGGECINGTTTLTTRQAFEQFSLIFQGKVIEIEDPHAPGLTQVLTFDVEKVWKGAVTERQVIYHAVSFESRIFSVGDRLVVFAHELSRETRLRVGLQPTGPPAFGYSFDCVTDMTVDLGSELPRMPSSKPH